MREEVIAVEVGDKTVGKLGRVALDVAIDAGGESLVDVTRVGVDERIAGDGALVRGTGREVALDAVAPESASELAARADEVDRDARTVVLRLDVA